MILPVSHEAYPREIQGSEGFIKITFTSFVFYTIFEAHKLL